MTPQQEDWLALTLVEGLGQKTLLGLCARFGGIAGLLAAAPEEVASASRLDAERARRIGRAREVDAFRIERGLVAEHGVRLLTLEDEAYPPLLRETDVPPPMLYWKSAGGLPQGLTLAVVGTRKLTRYGEKTVRRLIAEVAELAPETVIVSGLARGIDTVAHQQALESGLHTIAVLGCGLARMYPPENEGLAARIMEQGGLLSEFPMTTPPLGTNFPIRNRIISGLSRGILIAEADEKSGALITAGFGLNHNRELFAVPGNLDAPTFRGTNRLIQKGQAKLVRGGADMLEELRAFHGIAPEQMTLLPKEGVGLSLAAAPPGSDKFKVIQTLHGGAMHPDDLSRETALPMERLLGILLELELSGDVYQTAEHHFAIA